MSRRSTRQSLQATERETIPKLSETTSRKKTRVSKSEPSSTKKQGPTTKSHYFKPNKNNDDEHEDFVESSDHTTGTEESDSPEDTNYGDVSDHESTGSPEEDDYSDEQPKRKRKGASIGTTLKKSAERKIGHELWRAGAAIDAPPGTQVIIKKPKARPAGDTPYSDGTIHPNTLLFLKDLKANNDREWFKMHDPDYRTSLNDWNTFVGVLTQKLIEIDELVPELPTKDLTFRIHRDIRFSPDKTPYKPYFSAAWSRTGRKGPYAHYYVQVSPGNNSFVGGGLWQPEAQALAALRRDIDQNPQRLKNVLMNEGIRAEMLGGISKHPQRAVQAFVSSAMNSETALKRQPKGYDIAHPDIDLLRLRNFTIGRKLEDSEVLDAQGFLGRVTDLLAVIHPFVTCLNRIVLPDPGDDEGDDDDDDGEDSEDSQESEDSEEEEQHSETSSTGED